MTSEFPPQPPVGRFRRRRGLAVASLLTSPVSLYVLLAGALGESGTAVLSLAVVPATILGLYLYWLTRHDVGSRHRAGSALMWGATVAVAFAALINGAFIRALEPALSHDGASVLTAVAVAPLAEEALKLLGVWVIARRWSSLSPLRSVALIGFVALSFTVVEDVLYFSSAAADGQLAESFVLRGLITPFAHTMFCLPAAVGLAAWHHSRRTSVLLGGLARAVSLHGLWNLSNVLLISPSFSSNQRGIVGAAWGALFLIGVDYVVKVRRMDRRRSKTAAWPPPAVMPVSS